MSTADAAAWDRLGEELVVDRVAIALAGLFLLVMVATVGVVVRFQAIEYAAQGPPGVDGGSASTGAAWAIVEVAWAGLLLVAILAWRYLPEWLQDLVKWNVFVTIYMLLGGLGAIAGEFWSLLAAVVVTYSGFKTLDHLGLLWLLNNVLCLAAAVAMAAVAATWFGPAAIIVALLLLTVYDYALADRTDWMFELGEGLLNLHLPVLFVVPKRWRVDWDDIVAAAGGDEEAEGVLSWGIGTADMLLPAMFAGAVAYSGDVLAGGATAWAVAGVVGGTLLACLRMRQKMLTKGGGAGLPPITAGAIGGYVLMALPWVVLG